MHKMVELMIIVATLLCHGISVYNVRDSELKRNVPN